MHPGAELNFRVSDGQGTTQYSHTVQDDHLLLPVLYLVERMRSSLIALSEWSRAPKPPEFHGISMTLTVLRPVSPLTATAFGLPRGRGSRADEKPNYRDLPPAWLISHSFRG
jgi:hypothetical protein